MYFFVVMMYCDRLCTFDETVHMAIDMSIAGVMAIVELLAVMNSKAASF